MSRVDDLVSNYEDFVALPWQQNLAPPQRVWMAVYSPEDERRLRLHLGEFEIASSKAGHEWGSVDISTKFEEWMAGHDYRDEYFAEPSLMEHELAGFFDELVGWLQVQVEEKSFGDSVVGIIGAGSLFGLGEQVKVSSLVEQVQDLVKGRILVFFPGTVEGNNFRLMGAQDGWNYHATVIGSEKGWAV